MKNADILVIENRHIDKQTQIDFCKEFAKANQFTVAQVVEDPNLLNEEIVILYDLSILGRDLKKAKWFIKRLLKNGKNVFSAINNDFTTIFLSLLTMKVKK